MGSHDYLVPLVVFECEQVKFRPKKKAKIKVPHRDSMGWEVGGGGGGERRPSSMT